MILKRKLLIVLCVFYSLTISFSQKNSLKFSIHSKRIVSFKLERKISNSESLTIGYQLHATVKGNIRGRGLLKYGDKANFGNRFRFEYKKKLKELNSGELFFCNGVSYGHHTIIYEKISPFPIGKNSGKESVFAITFFGGIGYQKIGDKAMFETGVLLNKNMVIGDIHGISFADGTFEEFSNELNGFSFEFYISVGKRF